MLSSSLVNFISLKMLMFSFVSIFMIIKVSSVHGIHTLFCMHKSATYIYMAAHLNHSVQFKTTKKPLYPINKQIHRESIGRCPTNVLIRCLCLKQEYARSLCKSSILSSQLQIVKEAKFFTCTS